MTAVYANVEIPSFGSPETKAMAMIDFIMCGVQFPLPAGEFTTLTHAERERIANWLSDKYGSRP